VKQSDLYFGTVADANRAGRKALGLFLSEYQDEVSPKVGRSKNSK
jgi:hypothetical protein